MLVIKMFPLPEADQLVVVRAIAYSGLPEWKTLLRNVAPRAVTAIIGPADQPAAVELAREEAAQQPLRLLFVESFQGVAILDQLDSDHRAHAAHVPDKRKLIFPSGRSLAHRLPNLAGAA